MRFGVGTTTWTDAEIEHLKAELPSGKSYSQIGEVIGKSKGSVAGQVRRLGLKHLLMPVSARPRKEKKRRPSRAKPRAEKPATGLPIEPVKVALPEGHTGVLFADTQGEVCRFPLWGARELTGNVCGLPGYPWCDAHKNLVYRPRGVAA